MGRTLISGEESKMTEMSWSTEKRNPMVSQVLTSLRLTSHWQKYVYTQLNSAIKTAKFCKDDASRAPTPEFRPSGRPNRKIRLPKHYRDELPPLPPSVPLRTNLDTDHHIHSSSDASQDPEGLPVPMPTASVPLAYSSLPNSYHLLHISGRQTNFFT